MFIFFWSDIFRQQKQFVSSLNEILMQASVKFCFLVYLLRSIYIFAF